MYRNTLALLGLRTALRGFALAIVATVLWLRSNDCCLADPPDSRPVPSSPITKLEPFDLSYRPARSVGIHAVVGIRPAILVCQPGMPPLVKRLKKLWDDFQAERKYRPL